MYIFKIFTYISANIGLKNEMLIVKYAFVILVCFFVVRKVGNSWIKRNISLRQNRLKLPNDSAYVNGDFVFL